MTSSVVMTRGVLRPLVQLALPVLAEQLLAMMIGFSDTLLVGHYLGESHLAAMTLLNYMIWACYGLFAMISIGATALVARFVGSGDWTMANRVTGQALLVGVALALPITLVSFLLGERLVWAFDLKGEAADLATRFLYWQFPIIPLIVTEAVLIACLRGAGDTITGLVAMIAVNVVNIALSWGLLLGIGPLPRLGWDGLAVGASAGFTLGGLITLAVLLHGRRGLKLERRWLSLDAPLARRLLSVGLPGGVDMLSVIGCQLVFLGLVNHLGTLAVAAHGVALRLESIAYLPGSAFEVAAGTMAGQFLGAGDRRRAIHSVLAASTCGTALMILAASILYFRAEPLVDLFLGANQEAVAVVAAPLLRIVALAVLPLGLVMVLTGALRGAGDTRWPLVFTLIGFLGVRFPVAWLLSFAWGWGIDGAWYAIMADLTVRAALFCGRFAHGGWQRVKV
ncbi:MAG TPA: MATE family efflux transporter [Pirellulales bacterium]|nr:MATE family efflux transporter [Pirellulales bacterium]